MRASADVQLDIYNEALRLVGERQLSSLNEQSETRRLLDNAWASNLVDTVLEAGQWNFAMRAVSLTYSPSVEPAFGYQYTFTQPDDLVRLCALCEDSRFECPLLRYMDVNGLWIADLDTIYIKYVSNDSVYGADYSTWTNLFRKYVACYLAVQVAPRLKQSEAQVLSLEKRMERRLVEARSLDAMADPTKFPPTGDWVRARWGRRGGRWGR